MTGAMSPSPIRISTAGASRRCAARCWAARPRSMSWRSHAATRPTTTAGRRRARGAGPLPTCCRTSSVSRAGRTARTSIAAAVGYLHPAMKRKNLSVEVRAHVARIMMERNRATGVDYEKGGQALHANAEREIILCGGAFNSPQVLMLSGIGPADHLRSVGIDPRIDLPVGKNLQDHL